VARFVNREDELGLLESWWGGSGARMALVWGRRRIGKTALIQQFAREKPVVYHAGSRRPSVDELRVVSRLVRDELERSIGDPVIRDLEARPFADWDDCFDTLALVSQSKPLLLVLDEFPELVRATPELESVLRSFWDRARAKTKLRILLCGSAVSTMKAIQQERAPLYGRFDLSLRVDPFRPHEAARMLTRVKASDRPMVWGVTGGVPLYLEWWDQTATIRANLRRLVTTPGGSLLTEGDYVLATEGDSGDLARQILFAVAAGRTKYNEIAQVVGTNPSRTLDNLEELRLIERVVPVTELRRRTRRSTYRVADNFLAFWLGIVSRYRAEIDRGLGASVVGPIIRDLDNHMSACWEEAFRTHVRRLATEGSIPDVVGVGSFWTTGSDSVEIDAVALAGDRHEAVLVGEAKWARSVNGGEIRHALEGKVTRLPRLSADLEYAVCAREKVTNAGSVRAITARDIF